MALSHKQLARDVTWVPLTSDVLYNNVPISSLNITLPPWISSNQEEVEPLLPPIQPAKAIGKNNSHNFEKLAEIFRGVFDRRSKHGYDELQEAIELEELDDEKDNETSTTPPPSLVHVDKVQTQESSPKLPQVTNSTKSSKSDEDDLGEVQRKFKSMSTKVEDGNYAKEFGVVTKPMKEENDLVDEEEKFSKHVENQSKMFKWGDVSSDSEGESGDESDADEDVNVESTTLNMTTTTTDTLPSPRGSGASGSTTLDKIFSGIPTENSSKRKFKEDTFTFVNRLCSNLTFNYNGEKRLVSQYSRDLQIQNLMLTRRDVFDVTLKPGFKIGEPLNYPFDKRFDMLIPYINVDILVLNQDHVQYNRNAVLLRNIVDESCEFVFVYVVVSSTYYLNRKKDFFIGCCVLENTLGSFRQNVYDGGVFDIDRHVLNKQNYEIFCDAVRSGYGTTRLSVPELTIDKQMRRNEVEKERRPKGACLVYNDNNILLYEVSDKNFENMFIVDPRHVPMLLEMSSDDFFTNKISDRIKPKENKDQLFYLYFLQFVKETVSGLFINSFTVNFITGIAGAGKTYLFRNEKASIVSMGSDIAKDTGASTYQVVFRKNSNSSKFFIDEMGAATVLYLAAVITVNISQIGSIVGSACFDQTWKGGNYEFGFGIEPTQFVSNPKTLNIYFGKRLKGQWGQAVYKALYGSKESLMNLHYNQEYELEGAKSSFKMPAPFYTSSCVDYGLEVRLFSYKVVSTRNRKSSYLYEKRGLLLEQSNIDNVSIRKSLGVTTNAATLVMEYDEKKDVMSSAYRMNLVIGLTRAKSVLYITKSMFKFLLSQFRSTIPRNPKNQINSNNYLVDNFDGQSNDAKLLCHLKSYSEDSQFLMSNIKINKYEYLISFAKERLGCSKVLDITMHQDKKPKVKSSKPKMMELCADFSYKDFGTKYNILGEKFNETEFWGFEIFNEDIGFTELRKLISTIRNDRDLIDNKLCIVIDAPTIGHGRPMKWSVTGHKPIDSSVGNYLDHTSLAYFVRLFYDLECEVIFKTSTDYCPVEGGIEIVMPAAMYWKPERYWFKRGKSTNFTISTRHMCSIASHTPLVNEVHFTSCPDEGMIRSWFLVQQKEDDTDDVQYVDSLESEGPSPLMFHRDLVKNARRLRFLGTTHMHKMDDGKFKPSTKDEIAWNSCLEMQSAVHAISDGKHITYFSYNFELRRWVSKRSELVRNVNCRKLPKEIVNKCSNYPVLPSFSPNVRTYKPRSFKHMEQKFPSVINRMIFRSGDKKSFGNIHEIELSKEMESIYFNSFDVDMHTIPENTQLSSLNGAIVRLLSPKVPAGIGNLFVLSSCYQNFKEDLESGFYDQLTSEKQSSSKWISKMKPRRARIYRKAKLKPIVDPNQTGDFGKIELSPWGFNDCREIANCDEKVQVVMGPIIGDLTEKIKMFSTHSNHQLTGGLTNEQLAEQLTLKDCRVGIDCSNYDGGQTYMVSCLLAKFIWKLTKRVLTHTERTIVKAWPIKVLKNWWYRIVFPGTMLSGSAYTYLFNSILLRSLQRTAASFYSGYINLSSKSSGDDGANDFDLSIGAFNALPWVFSSIGSKVEIEYNTGYKKSYNSQFTVYDIEGNPIMVPHCLIRGSKRFNPKMVLFQPTMRPELIISKVGKYVLYKPSFEALMFSLHRDCKSFPVLRHLHSTIMRKFNLNLNLSYRWRKKALKIRSDNPYKAVMSQDHVISDKEEDVAIMDRFEITLDRSSCLTSSSTKWFEDLIAQQYLKPIKNKFGNGENQYSIHDFEGRKFVDHGFPI